MIDQQQFEEDYQAYINEFCPQLDEKSLKRIKDNLQSTSWDTPQSSLDFNNIGVLCLLSAEKSSDKTERQLYLNIALDVFNQGIEIDNNPFCIAHLSILLALIGELTESNFLSFPNLIEQISLSSFLPKDLPSGLIYIPQKHSRLSSTRQEILGKILATDRSDQQSLILLAWALDSSHLIFYNEGSLRSLNFVTKILPETVFFNLKLGTANLVNQQMEGLFYLHQSHHLSSHSPEILQALYIAYRDLTMMEAEKWLNLSRTHAENSPNNINWKWTQLNLDSPFTYVPFDQEILLAVEPSFHSCVTAVLMVEGDWFEYEMEFWRDFIQPGMTVIDVGANVGVYTFTAATRVGSAGSVLAIEPFSTCLNCLQETRRINQLEWVKICNGAASNHRGKARLYLHVANELNEIITEEDEQKITEMGLFEEVECFPLDSLIDSQELTKVDIIKIDAEGHEMAVLSGCEEILSKFRPLIMYENIATGKQTNDGVAPYLESRGYQLFFYQPYIQDLIPITSSEQLARKLNAIAIPEGHYLLQ